MTGGQGRWLIIGNSRWHWAEGFPGGPLRVWHQAPPEEGSRPEEGSSPDPPTAWAAVGAVPPTLPPAGRLSLSEVPLAGMPPWLGIDRALGGWWAWRGAQAPVLLADAGTVLSLTRVNRQGGFAGGRLLAGVALQLRAMVAAARGLQGVGLDAAAAAANRGTEEAGMVQGEGGEPWPRDTAAAMREGVRRGLAAAIATAAREAVHQLAAAPADAGPPLHLVLTGGDGPLLEGLVAEATADLPLAFTHRPGLCLEGLSSLRPVQATPRSARI